MATSSIFHKIVIDTPERAERFIAALEASEREYEQEQAMQKEKPKSNIRPLMTDPEEIRKFLSKGKKSGKILSIPREQIVCFD